MELPSESLTNEDKSTDLVGLLKMSLYGTRDAAMNWRNGGSKEESITLACTTTESGMCEHPFTVMISLASGVGTA